MSMQTKWPSGAVAIFSVVFATLLIMIVTVGFMMLMIGDQRQSTNSDLSESAYDSALTGVEDAKRLIIAYADCKGNSSTRCNNIRSVFTGAELKTDCYGIADAGFGSVENGETLIAQSETDKELNQAYTCVEVTMNTLDYLGELSDKGSGTLIPLQSAGGAQFNRLKISWFTQNDVGGPNVTLRTGVALPRLTAWGPTTPPIVRATVIQPDGNISLDDLNETDSAATLFLYPNTIGNTTFQTSLDVRDHDGGDGSEAPLPVRCVDSLVIAAYSCEATIELGGNTTSAYLLLAALYNSTQYRVELFNSSDDPVRFNGTQPMVDSTGRASDIFRRVESRVELVGTTLAYPTTAVSVAKNFCKTFSVTDDPAEYDAGACDPTLP